MIDQKRVPLSDFKTRVLIYAAVLLATALGAVPVLAEQAKIVGLGATGCAQFSLEVKQNPALQRDYLAWAQGFMSGVLLSKPIGVDQSLELIPSTVPLLKQLEILREHCEKNPSDDFSDAVLSLYERLRRAGAT